MIQLVRSQQGDAGAVSVPGLQEVTEFTSRNRFVSPCRRECVWFTPSGGQRPDASSYVDKIAERPEDYRVLERLPLDEKSVPVKFEGAGEPVRWVAILDTETTGFGPDDRVLELAIVRCGIDASGNLCSVDEVLDEFNDPGFEIPAEVGALTGITDGMVRGKRVDSAKVEHILSGDPVIVAHNAGFDRPFFEKLFPDDGHKWVCSMEYCDWQGRGFSGRGLGYLVQQEGFFFDAHRAYMDCLAVVALLYVVPGIVDEILEPRVKVTAVDSPFEVKDDLKYRRYSWDRDGRKWFKVLAPGAVDEEMTFLKKLYPNGYMATRTEVDQRKEFKGRG